MLRNVLRNRKDAQIPHHSLRSAINGFFYLGRNHESRMVEAYGFLSNLSSQFYGFQQWRRGWSPR